MLSLIARLIAPPLCVGCNHEGNVLCHACQEKIEPPLSRCTYCKKHNEKLVCEACSLVSKVDDIYVAGLYSGVLRDLIGVIKFNHQRYAVRVAAELLARRIINAKVTFDAIVPVPTSPPRIRQRGFDQTKELAKHLSKILGLGMQTPLYRQKFDRQVGQNREKRLLQAKNQFKIHGSVAGNVLLVDDVITTGATIAACAVLLKNAGAHKVIVAVIAQD